MGKDGKHLLVGATSPDSIRSLIVPLIPYLVDAGWSVTLIASDTTTTPALPRVKSIALPMSRSMSPLADIRALTRWQRVLKEQRPDVLLAGSPKAGFLAMSAGRLAGVETRVYQHWGARWETERGWRRRLIMEADRITMQSATHVLAVSRSLANLVFANRLVSSRPIVLGRGGSTGVNRNKFAPGSCRNPDSHVYGFLGRLSRDKGIEYLLETFRRVQRVQPEATLLVGGAVDAAQPISTQVEYALRRAPGVQWLGQITDTPTFLNRLDVLIFPSLREGLPNVVIEASACGIPTVGWDVTGVRDAILPGVTGSLEKTGDVAALAREAVTWSLRSNAARSDCRKWSASFSEETVAGNLIDYLDSLHRS